MSSRARLSLLAFFAIAALVCVRLGAWQVGRLKDRRAMNLFAAGARAAPPIRLDSAMTGDSSLIERRVTALGHYDHAHDLVLRGRAYEGSPGVEIVTPLVFPGERTAVLVNRGFVPSPDALTVETDSLREPGEVRVEGLALAVPSGGGEPLERGGHASWKRLDLESLNTRLPYTLSPIYIRQTPGSGDPLLPRRLSPPPLDDGPHLSYAVQWFSFAIMAVVFGVVVLRQKREREKPNVSGERGSLSP